MKHLVFVVDYYSSNPSANGICVEKIVDGLDKKYKISIIEIKHTHNQLLYDEDSNISLYRCETKESRARLSSKNKINLVRIKGQKYLKLMASKATIDKNLVIAYKDIINKVNNENKIDVLIPICFPFEGVEASRSYAENKDIKLIPILYDKFAESFTLHRNNLNKKFKLKNNKSLELNMISSSDYLIASKDWKNYFKNNNMEKNKIFYSGIPSLSNEFENYTKKSPINNKYTMLYAGAINKKSRPIDFFMSFIEDYMAKYHNLDLYFYGDVKQVKKAMRTSRIDCHNLSLNMPISRHTLIKKYFEVDILCSLGNIDISQTPSKIFEYMSTGLPIVHFYYDENDPVIGLINQYGNGINLPQKNYKEVDLLRLKEFLAKTPRRLDFKNVSKMFPDENPKYTSDLLINLIERN